MNTPPPVPPENSTPAPAPAPVFPPVPPPPVPLMPAAELPAGAAGAAPGGGNLAMEKMAAALRQVNWQQVAAEAKLFPARFASGDFALIRAASSEMPAVEGLPPLSAAHTVWRRALLWMAFVLSVVLLVKSLCGPLTVRPQIYESQVETLAKQNAQLPGQARHAPEQIEKLAEEQTKQMVTMMGEDNLAIINGIIAGQLLTLLASAVLQGMAARQWRVRRASHRYALWAAGVLLLYQAVVMLTPWASLMDFKHLEQQGGAPDFAGMDPAAMNEAGKQAAGQAKMFMQLLMAVTALSMAVPFFYGLFNGVLRASLSAKTLVPASIVCGWASMLLAITIAVPWVLILSVANQFEAHGLIFLGLLCLIAAPLSIVFKSRRLGSPLSSGEASPVVKRARILLTALNFTGVAMIASHLIDKEVVKASQLISAVLHYFANLMLVSVVAVDLLVRILERAHRKLVADTAPDQSLRQLGEALPP